MPVLALIVLLLSAGFAEATSRSTANGPVDVTVVANRLDVPWGLAFLPGGAFLVTERSGRLLRFDADGTRHRVSGVPNVRAKGQGGLLDVLVPRDFARSRQVFLSLAKPKGSGAGTAVGVGRLSEDGNRLDDFRTILEMDTSRSSGRHFGSRLVEASNGTIFVTLGERGEDMSAQDVAGLQGSVARITRTGGIPTGNPFVARSGARGEIWSYGHRNPQGMAFDSKGRLWVVEHGARGGDEVNLIQKGANYGWPVIAYGRHYNGAAIGEGTSKPGMKQPTHFWDPSIAPSGLAIISGTTFPTWRGSFLVGSLKFDMISRLEWQGDRLVEVERLSWPETDRVRDVRQAPDGSIWFLSEGRGAVLRIAPASE